MGILNHVWGVSREQDAVWAHVCGLAPERANRRLLMIWQGYFDESEKDGWFVLAGYLASVSKWASFSAEWAKLAKRYGRVDEKGRRHFHMAEQANADGASEYLPQLRELISETVLTGVAFAMKPGDFRRATRRIIGIKDGIMRPFSGNLVRNHYLFAIEAFIDTLAWRTLHEKPPLDAIEIPEDRVDLIFDNRSEAGIIYAAWEDFKRTRAENNILTSPPRFEDDKEFLPLQAADFLAYWFRRSLSGISKPADFQISQLFPFARKKVRRRTHYFVDIQDEESLVRRWMSIQREGMQVIDANTIVTSSLTRK